MILSLKLYFMKHYYMHLHRELVLEFIFEFYIQDLRTDSVITVITTIGSNSKPLFLGNECVSPNIVSV